MKLIVGLGNPGSKYQLTRHNVGFLLVDYLAQIRNSGNDFKILKPQTFMNRSGLAVRKELQFYKLTLADLWLVHDDLDLRLGEWKIQLGKGPKLHYGVDSVEKELGCKDFYRVRIGVDNRDSENRVSGENYVLQKFLASELELLQAKIFPEVVKKLI